MQDSSATMLMQQAASFDWEALLPVVFFLLYGISQLLGGKKKKDTAEEEPNQDEVEAMERARQIREEIRRKIEERRKGAKGGQPASSGRGYDPTVPETQRSAPQGQQRPIEEPVQRPMVDPRTVVSAPIMREEPEPVVSDTPDIETLLAEQRKRLLIAQRTQRQARAKTEEIASRVLTHQAHSGSTSRYASFSGKFRDELIKEMRDPNNIRKGILYKEILGKPIGLR